MSRFHTTPASLQNIGIPGLPRVIDALSTIMWPSMIQSQQTQNRKSKARELLDWAREEEEDDGLRALVMESQIPGGGSGDKKSRMQREMEELERWLEGEEELRATDGDPWVNVSTTGNLVDPLGMTTSPMGMDSPQAITMPWTAMESVSESQTTQQSGFDDDFTVFVSAPAGPSGRSTPNVSFDSDMLDPVHTGASYRSLGSVSDFGDHRDEDDLPSEAEIQATSARIFGPTLSSSASLTPTSTSHPAPLSPSPFSTSTSFSHSDDGGHKSEDEEDYEVGNFDLSRVLNALQTMKEEISGMENEDERRKAAARAALGLVYGLERQGDDDDMEV